MRSSVRNRLARFSAFSLGVLIGEAIFRPDGRLVGRPHVGDVWRAEVDAIEAEFACSNDVRIGSLVRALVFR